MSYQFLELQLAFMKYFSLDFGLTGDQSVCAPVRNGFPIEARFIDFLFCCRPDCHLL